eukprot:gb/GECG01015194.1/.p1 GENE.gb/GECG01015194.1/~~gb/GECG01015194.1/.p1  ORF type:complete len:940 (+),score=149.70 gb/GECG01015194.1/:1-2820(+)
MSVNAIVRRYREGNTTAAGTIASMGSDDYLEGFPAMVDAFLEIDFREALTRDQSIQMARHEEQVTAFFGNLSHIAASEPERIQPLVEKIGPLVSWWVHVLTNTELSLPGTEAALQQILGCLNMLLSYARVENAEVVIKMAIDGLKVKSASSSAASIVTQLAQQDKRVVSSHMNELLIALEKEIDEGALSSLLTAIDGVYQRCAEDVNEHIDTIVDYAVTRKSASIAGSMIISKVAKKFPRLLYAFVEDLVLLLSRQHCARFILGAFSDIAARNALLFADHLEEIAFASVETGLSHDIGLPAVGYIGRINEDKAQQVMKTLVEWIQDDVDPAANSKILVQIRNVGGVYKKTLDPYAGILRKLCSHGDSDVKDEATKLVDYYDGKDPYLPDTFLDNQEDIHGRLIELVTSTVDAKTKGIEETVEDLAKKADHHAKAIKDVEEKHYVLADNVTAHGGRVNKLELLAKEHDRRLESVEESVEKIEEELANRTEEIKEFIADVTKKLPVPVSVEARGKIRKRIRLRFCCAAGTKPDFILESVHWTKWLRVVASALNTGKSIFVGDIAGTVGGLLECFKALKRKDTDRSVKFENLVKQPFLTSVEQDELIEGLRSQGFFEEFEYDANSASWRRKPRSSPATFSDTASSAYAAREDESTNNEHDDATKHVDEQETPPDAIPKEVKNNTADVVEHCPTTEMSYMYGNSLLCKGVFKKKGQVRKSIKERFYEVTPEALRYYTDSSKEKLKGIIWMESIASVETLSGQWIRLNTPGVHGGHYSIHVLDSEEYSLFLSTLEKYCYSVTLKSATLLQDCAIFRQEDHDLDDAIFHSATAVTEVFNYSSSGHRTNWFGPVFKVTGWLHNRSSKDGLVLWIKDIPESFGDITVEELSIDLSLANPRVKWDEASKQQAIKHLRKQFKKFDKNLSLVVLVDEFKEHLPVLDFPGN